MTNRLLPELSNVVGVNETTLNIICTKDYRILVESYSGSHRIDDEHPMVNGTKYLEKRCFIGGRRWQQKKCPEQNKQNDKSENDEKNAKSKQNVLNDQIQSIFSL